MFRLSTLTFRHLVLFLFLVINGHHWLISGIKDSFILLSPGNFVVQTNILPSMIRMSSQLFIIALKLRIIHHRTVIIDLR